MGQTAEVIQLPGTEVARIAATGVMLTAPKYNYLPNHDVVYGLAGGRVREIQLARYCLPKYLRAHMLVAPASGNADGQAVLPMIAEMADRMLPWATVHVVPRLLRTHDGSSDFQRSAGCYEAGGVLYKAAGGLAFADDGVIFLESSSPISMASLLCHEVMHHLWRLHLSDEAKEVLRGAVAAGAAWPGSYYDDIEERVCRLFERYCSARMEGLPAANWTSELTASWIMEACWMGELADQQLLADCIEGGNAIRARRGLVLPPPPAPARPPARAPMDVVVDALFTGMEWMAAAAGRAALRGYRRASAALA